MRIQRGAERPIGTTMLNAGGRGWRRRIKRLRVQENTPIQIWLLVTHALLVLSVLVPWLLLHGQTASGVATKTVTVVSDTGGVRDGRGESRKNFRPRQSSQDYPAADKSRRQNEAPETVGSLDAVPHVVAPEYHHEQADRERIHRRDPD